MVESVKATVKRYNMFSDERTVTVALSGGADSVALLSVLLSIKDEYSLNINAAHLNHLLRGEESDGDEAFVRKLCEDLKVPLFCERAEVLKAARQSGESIELAARNVRYAFLERVSEGLIATAHTADDNIETVLFNMARGTGLQGICGIPPKRGRIVRPLIEVTRRQVEDYCAQNGLEYKTDSSNLSDDYARNKIRHKAVPVLREINSAAVKNAALMSSRLRADEDYLSAAAEQEFSKLYINGGLSVEGLRKLHPAVQYRVIALLAKRESGLRLEHIHIEGIQNMLSSAVLKQSIRNDYHAVICDGLLKFEPPQSENEPFCFEVNRLPFSANGYRLSEISVKGIKSEEKFNNLLFKYAVDCDKICGVLSFRSRMPGDSISLRGRGCTKTFKKLFNENKIAMDVRNSLPVLSDGNGVVWLDGFGVDERVAVDESTKNVLIIEKCGMAE